jgi:hypothetical protein
MTQIKKFSQLYDTFEDRMAWDTEDADGVPTRLWLTQRLCKGLAEAVVSMLTRDQAFPSGQQDVLQSWEQVAALADFGATPPVVPNPDMVTGLVKAVHMTPTDKGVSMTFELHGGETRAVGLTTQAIRQMLSVMHRLHAAAGWPMDFWPPWVADPAAAATAPAETIN